MKITICARSPEERARLRLAVEQAGHEVGYEYHDLPENHVVEDALAFGSLDAWFEACPAQDDARRDSRELVRLIDNLGDRKPPIAVVTDYAVEELPHHSTAIITCMLHIRIVNAVYMRHVRLRAAGLDLTLALTKVRVLER